MSTFFRRWVLLAGLLASFAVSADVLDQPVSLKTEADLIAAVSITLQHSVATSEQYRGGEPRLRRFARQEIGARRKPLAQLSKLSRIPLLPAQQLAIVPLDETSYRRAMLRNHARLIELIEHGGGLKLAPETKRLMEALSRSATAEFAMLAQMKTT